MKTLDQRIAGLIAVEGDFVDNHADRGGPTRFGITEAEARANGYKGDMRDLPIELARRIYTQRYWFAPHLDLVSIRAPHVAGEMFDTGVNMGTKAAAKLLQRALNVLHGDGLVVDGAISPGGATLKALDAYMAARTAQDGEAVLVELLNSFQGTRYAEIVEGDAKQRTFVFGQIRNRVMDRSASA
ncbi:glycoside hydrolase family 108 protein [Sphingomonas sp. PR090111-T3T-6A]|uniref:glycoside hydrolase family 108 protein n=1 Tax=Sphingomonas sp. PR090111-T3T-6A TaxID=685778 RepID=UPI00036045E6|nr:N-acetylmuramidase [Sphingomonas sp. PR090111-T3T-6A]